MRPMATTLNQFIGILARAGMVPEAELRAIQTQLEGHRDPDSLAKELAHTGYLTAYQASEFRDGQAQGLVLGEYVLLDPVGQGGMGRVYRARHMLMKRDVAVKLMLPPEDGSSKGSIERFQREVQAASKLSHPNIVSALDAGVEEGNCFFVMEYVRGANLRDIVYSRGPLAVEEAVNWVIQAAEGLACAHAQGIIHRDVKPSNLLLSSDGVVKVLDMGLVRVHVKDALEDIAPGEDEKLTQRGQILGTVDFMAPEQAIDPHHADARSDIYGLGCTLYFLLTGRPPYGHGDDSPMSRIIAHRESPIPSLRAARPEAPELLERILRTMLAKQPARRYQSMDDALIYLRACQGQFGAPAAAETESFLAASPKQRRATFRAPAVGAISVVLISAAIVAWWSANRSTDSGTAPLANSAVASPTIPTDYWTNHSESVDLLGQIELNSAVVTGSHWRLEGGKLLTSPDSPAKIIKPFPVPAQYELELHATRRSGMGPLVIGLVAGEKQCFVLIDRQSDGRSVTALGTDDNGRMLVTAPKSIPLPLDRVTPILCIVRDGRISVSVENATTIDWTGSFQGLSLGAGWSSGITRPDILFLGANNDTVFEISRLELRPWSDSAPASPLTKSEAKPEQPDTSAL